MTDDIKARLQDTAANCLKAYEAWSENKKDGAARAVLQEAVHELRKVGARVEIELAVSDRDESNKKKIPIPAHRDSRNRSGEEEYGDSAGNTNQDNGNSQGQGGSAKPRRPRRKPQAN